MAVGGAEVSAERMSLAVGRIDPWNLLWVMPAKGTRCHHTFTFSPRVFFRPAGVKRGKCVCLVALCRVDFPSPGKGAVRKLRGFSWSLTLTPSKQKEGDPHEEKRSQRDEREKRLGAASPDDRPLARFTQSLCRWDAAGRARPFPRDQSDRPCPERPRQ